MAAVWINEPYRQVASGHARLPRYLLYLSSTAPIPCPALPAWPAWWSRSRGSPNGFRRALVKPAPPSQRAKGPRGPAEGRGGPIGPKVSRPLPQLFEFPGPYPVDQHQQKKHRQSRPFRRAALIQAVKAPDQTAGRHLQCKNGRAFARASAPPPNALWTARHPSLFQDQKPKLKSRSRSK